MALRVMRIPLVTALVASTALAGCTMAPRYERPAAPIPQSWPSPADTTAAGIDAPWRDVFTDPRLQGVIQLALEQNRDLRAATANIERARAAYRIQRADLLPGIDATGQVQRGRTPAGATGQGQALETELYSVSAGFAAYELDLFGRVRSLGDAALQSFFAAAEDRRAAGQPVAEVAAAYLTLAADQDLVGLTRTPWRAATRPSISPASGSTPAPPPSST